MVYSTVSSHGLTPTSQIVNSSARLMVLNQRQAIFRLECHRVHTLAPLLILIYINDLPLALQDYIVSMYADDASLCFQSDDVTQLNKATSNDLKRLDNWHQGNKLSLNVARVHSMLLASKQKHRVLEQQQEGLNLNVFGNMLQFEQNITCLGVQFDSLLYWKEQIKIVSVKVSRALDLLMNAKNILPILPIRAFILPRVVTHLPLKALTF